MHVAGSQCNGHKSVSQHPALLLSTLQHLTGLVEWSVPTAGMFLWLRLLHVQGRAGGAFWTGRHAPDALPGPHTTPQCPAGICQFLLRLVTARA